MMIKLTHLLPVMVFLESQFLVGVLSFRFCEYGTNYHCLLCIQITKKYVFIYQRIIFSLNHTVNTSNADASESSILALCTTHLSNKS